jgi:hypothetical protein
MSNYLSVRDGKIVSLAIIFNSRPSTDPARRVRELPREFAAYGAV